MSALPDLNARFNTTNEDENAATGQLIQLTVQNLADDKLIGIKGPFDTVPKFVTKHWTTGLGNAFLAFITSDGEQ